MKAPTMSCSLRLRNLVSLRRRLLNTLRRDAGSSPTRTSVHLPPKGTPRLPAAFPIVSPSPKQRVDAPPARTPSPKPLLSGNHDYVVYQSPTRTPRKTPASPSKRPVTPSSKRPNSPTKRPQTLPEHLQPWLAQQKRAIMKSLQQFPELDEIELYGEDYPPTNTAAYEQLGDLLIGSVVRGEGNSCMLIGPSGSGKTQMVQRAIEALPREPIVIRLSGHSQQNDRVAIREIAWQLAQQTGQSFLPSDEDDADDGVAQVPAKPEDDVVEPETYDEDVDEEHDEDENPFLTKLAPPFDNSMPIIALPPPAHLLALISMIPTLPRPTVIVVEGFDLFAEHARQSLLYCLLDTAQACRAGTGSGSGMAIIGVTSRVDTLNLLEKRVKSRFSGRMIRTASPARFQHWIDLTKAVLSTPPPAATETTSEDGQEWTEMWQSSVETFVKDREVVDILRETYSLTRDFHMFGRIMTCFILELTPQSPYPTFSKLSSAVERQRCPARYPPLHTLPYPAVCLLIASVHAQTAGHDTFTFEMLHDAFKSQVRTSQSAPVQVAGGGLGMAFERLVDLRMFLAAAAPAASISKEFALHRSAVDRFSVKEALRKIGQMNLKKWFTKA
ncbi:origin recognition complex subunit 4 C-terminus-domain-containing protein [Epithele typhae]|uniref:origin recognition complex subunit 4 C-terminus-domain-containing protein n=1 Tax=Epithele typhae TaxID=378194 RepID=UPI002007C2A4|nr:origin recognition complex subunit 4 C-terminus-domain-containing protein [Epithele typhae]KAH9927098.1 origin recognition complex subunit 4 C-terminus-domain-containing protein [Epithele typhae]